MSAPEFTTEQIRMIAEVERDMDQGKIPFVVCDGQRVATSDECMDELGLEAGQTINSAIFQAMCLFGIKQCQEKIAERETANAIARAQGGAQ